MRRNYSAYRILFVLSTIGVGMSLIFGLVNGVKANKIDPAIDNLFSSPLLSDLSDLNNNEKPSIQVVDQDNNGIVFELKTPLPKEILVPSKNGSCQLLEVSGFATTERPGWAQLPVTGTLVGIPLHSTPSLTGLEYEEVMLPGKFTLCPVVTPIIKNDLDGNVTVDGYERISNQEANLQDHFSPEKLIEISSTGFIRSQRIMQLYFQPFQYNPVTGELRYFSRIRARLDFNPSSEDFETQGSYVEESGFEQLLKASLLNYAQARSWRIMPASTVPQTSHIEDQNQPQFKILVSQSGIYQVTYADLLAAGATGDILDAVDPLTISMSNQGQEIDILVSGEQDGKFDPGDVIYFYGEGLNTVSTNTNVYWLKWGSSSGSRMIEVSGTPSGMAAIPSYFEMRQHLEENHNYLTAYPSGPNNDHWYWNFIYASSLPGSANYTTTIEHIVSTPMSIIVSGIIKGYSATPYHHTIIKLNGNIIHDSSNWDAHAEYAFNVAVPETYLQQGVNTITVESPLDRGITSELIFVNYFDIVYFSPFVATDDQLSFSHSETGIWEFQVAGYSSNEFSVFDITNPQNPKHVINANATLIGDTYMLSFEQNLISEKKYLALSNSRRLSPDAIVLDLPSDLLSSTNSADYILITHSDFIPEAQRLADYRAGQGLRTMVVDVQDVYDEFSWGIFAPNAIKDFLAYAYISWTPPAPAFVVLFGDGNYDYKDNFGEGEINYVPPYLADVDPWIGETAAENRYVAVSGNDLLPDMHLGRLPVKSPSQAHQLVNKIIQYETNNPINDWNQKLLFVADNADIAGDFAAISDSIIESQIPTHYLPEKLYYLVTHSSAPTIRSALLQAINQGRLLVNYIGHASPYVWANEELFTAEDIALLSNLESNPFMIPMTCMDGYFIRPSSQSFDASSIGESIVASTPNGAISSWSPTGLGVASGHDFLNKGLFEALFTDDVIQLGPATTLAKLYLAANSTLHNDLLDTYILFGDPATQLNVPPAEVSISKTVSPTGVLDPGDQITYTLTFTNSGITTAHHVVVTDQLPTMLINPVVTYSGVPVNRRPGTSYIWDVEDIDPGETGVITITATTDPTFYGSIANTASIATSARELDRLNNTTAPVTTLVQRPTSTLLGLFTATSQPGAILLAWETTSEVDLTGFYLYRSDAPNGLLVKVNPEVVAPESPGSGTGHAYELHDSNVIPGLTYYYWIELITNHDTYINGPISEFAKHYLHAPLLTH